MKKNNVFIIAAHPDDEVLGAGGSILKHVDVKDTVRILILSDGEKSKSTKVNVEQRQKQAHKVAGMLKVKDLILEKFPDNQFDSLPILQIIKKIECHLQKIKPNIIYTHFVHDLNIDHQLTFQAVLTACRPQPSFFVKKIFSFEIPSSTEWQIKDQTYAFCPNEYHDITNFINQKIEILKIYKGELRKYPHPRSIIGVKALAQLRGMEVGLLYAEGFQIVRNIED